MAYIKDTNAPTENLRVPGMDRSIDIPESGVVQVRSHEVGPLVEHCPTISEYKNDDKDEDN